MKELCWSSVLIILSTYICVTVGDYAEYAEFIRKQAKNATFVRMFNEHARLYQDKNVKAPFVFPCGVFPAPMSSKPIDVHSLTPYDISVIGALGDSLTAGTGITAKTIVGLLREDRGLSWSIGGSNSVQQTETVPNNLKVFNPRIKGFSTGWGPVWHKSASKFNVARPGDKSEHMPSQARELVKRMKSDSSVDFENDWKLITLFIGGNDLCKYCNNKNKYKAENYIANIEEALDYLHATVPRAFVNLVEVLDVTMVKQLNQNFICDTIHFFVCRCAAYPWNSKALDELKAEMQRYRDLTEALADSEKYDTRDDFTVVLQPFWKNTKPPLLPGTDKPDLSYFSPDCFHMSEKGHRAAAEALWDNMIEPVGKKRTEWTPGEAVNCPAMTAPYLYTKKNSNPSPQLDRDHIQNADMVLSNDGKAMNSDPNLDKTSSVSVAVIAIGCGLIGLGMTVVGVIVYRRRSHYREHSERKLLLNHVDNGIYS